MEITLIVRPSEPVHLVQCTSCLFVADKSMFAFMDNASAQTEQHIDGLASKCRYCGASALPVSDAATEEKIHAVINAVLSPDKAWFTSGDEVVDVDLDGFRRHFHSVLRPYLLCGSIQDQLSFIYSYYERKANFRQSFIRFL